MSPIGSDNRILVRSKAIDSKALFFVTSPRSPFKAIPEISLLVDNFNGEIWNSETQRQFYFLLRGNDFFEDVTRTPREPELAGRDRINRMPKALGFVRLPEISLTPAGEELLYSNNKDEVLLRQLLKFQIPSPYHPLSRKAARFWVKPYLEIFRLISDLGYLAFDEVRLFVPQMTDYKLYDHIAAQIQGFRRDKELNAGRYREFFADRMKEEVYKIYKEEILAGRIRTRESRTDSVDSFIAKKAKNFRDYADAAVRYLRATGMVSVSAEGKTLRILPERAKDVEYLLNTIKRDPVFVDEQIDYEDYLWDPEIPKLLSDDKEKIASKLKEDFGIIANTDLSINRLKDLLNEKIGERRESKINEQVAVLKNYQLFDEIETVFENIGNYYDPSLFFEWNTWRAMTMLDGGQIHPNLKFDDEGKPMSTALGKMPDIECDYGDFDVIVEVTRSSGQLQFKMEGEPVPRHIGLHKESAGKPTYCFFIAPIINPATIAHFFSLHVSNIQMYGGKCNIIPLPLDNFRKMLHAAVKADTKPNSLNIKRFFDKSGEIARDCFLNEKTETDWFNDITALAENWLTL